MPRRKLTHKERAGVVGGVAVSGIVGAGGEQLAGALGNPAVQHFNSGVVATTKALWSAGVGGKIMAGVGGGVVAVAGYKAICAVAGALHGMRRADSVYQSYEHRRQPGLGILAYPFAAIDGFFNGLLHGLNNGITGATLDVNADETAITNSNEWYLPILWGSKSTGNGLLGKTLFGTPAGIVSGVVGGVGALAKYSDANRNWATRFKFLALAPLAIAAGVLSGIRRALLGGAAAGADTYGALMGVGVGKGVIGMVAGIVDGADIFSSLDKYMSDLEKYFPADQHGNHTGGAIISMLIMGLVASVFMLIPNIIQAGSKGYTEGLGALVNTGRQGGGSVSNVPVQGPPALKAEVEKRQHPNNPHYQPAPATPMARPAPLPPGVPLRALPAAGAGAAVPVPGAPVAPVPAPAPAVAIAPHLP